MDPMTYKIKRFRRLQSGEVQELEPVRKEIYSDPIGNHIILLRKYIREVNELLDPAKNRNSKKELPAMPLPDYPENFPLAETLLRQRDFPKLRVRFLSPVSKAFVEQQQRVSILKILAHTGYYVTESKVIMVKQPKNKAKGLEAEEVSNKDKVSESEKIQKGDSTHKKNLDEENNECEKSKNGQPSDKESKNGQPNNKESENEEQENKIGKSKDEDSTDKVTENKPLGCEEELKNSHEADKGNENREKTDADTGGENRGKTNADTGDQNRGKTDGDTGDESTDSENEDTENEETENGDTEAEDSKFGNPISKDEEVPVQVLSYYLTEFIKNFVVLMQRIKLSEPNPDDNNLWNALETTLQRIGFGGIEGLYQFYHEKVYQRHDVLLEHCEDLHKKYNEYREKLNK